MELRAAFSTLFKRDKALQVRVALIFLYSLRHFAAELRASANFAFSSTVCARCAKSAFFARIAAFHATLDSCAAAVPCSASSDPVKATKRRPAAR